MAQVTKFITDTNGKMMVDQYGRPLRVTYEQTGGGAVDSVNGQTGVVVLDAEDVGAEPAFEKKSAFNKEFGTTAGTVCQGNDSRLSDARPANGGNSATVGGKSPSDFATSAQGKKADTAYQKPSTGIPESDLSSEVATKLNKTIPTLLSQLQNDTGFVTKIVEDLVNYYTKAQVDSKISQIPKFSIAPVDELPTENISETTVYLVKDNDETGNLYTEYIYVNGAWEKLGSQKLDLNGYATKEWVNAQISNFVTLEQLQEIRNIAESAYKKPAGGIPESDFDESTKAKLNKQYSLPIASESQLGGVKPATKTSSMTQTVGVDETGKLWTTPSSGGGSSNVVANPDDEATEELTKLKVNETTYSIPATEMTVSDVEDPNAIEIKTISFAGDKYKFPTGGGGSSGGGGLTYEIVKPNEQGNFMELVSRLTFEDRQVVYACVNEPTADTIDFVLEGDVSLQCIVNGVRYYGLFPIFDLYYIDSDENQTVKQASFIVGDRGHNILLVYDTPFASAQKRVVSATVSTYFWVRIYYTL